MSQPTLTTLMQRATTFERDAKAIWQSLSDPPEKDAALIVYRQAGAVRRAIEKWMVKRELRTSYGQRHDDPAAHIRATG